MKSYTTSVNNLCVSFTFNNKLLWNSGKDTVFGVVLPNSILSG